MEPVLPPSGGRFEAAAIALHREAAALAASAHPVTLAALARLVRVVNAYYSNLIEGVRTTPVEIERAMRADYAHDPGRAAVQRLAAAHVRVTFFLIGGNIRGREAIVRRELAQGNAIGDHTWTHPDLSALSSSAIRSQLTRTLAEIRRATGGGTALMRPPYGATDHRVAAIARRMGFAQILWSVDTNDWRDRNSRIVAHRAVTWAHRNDIILMHDIHPTTVAAVPQILRGLARRGFTFVTVPELFGDRPLRPGGVYFTGPPVPAKKAPAGVAPGGAQPPST